MSFLRTHAAAVWYNKLAGKTVRDKFDEVDAAVEGLEAKTLTYEIFNIGEITVSQTGYTEISALNGVKPLFCTISDWITNTGAFNLVTISNGVTYITGTPGVVVKGLKVKAWKYRG